LVIQFKYVASNNWTGGSWWNIYCDVVKGGISSAYQVKIYKDYYYAIVNATVSGPEINYCRGVVEAIGDIPGIEATNKRLFLIYDDSFQGLTDGGNYDDEVGLPSYYEGTVLRLSSDMISFAEFIQ